MHTLQTKTKRELNVKRILCIGGSLAAVVILIILMAGTSSRATPAKTGVPEVVGVDTTVTGMHPAQLYHSPMATQLTALCTGVAP